MKVQLNSKDLQKAMNIAMLPIEQKNVVKDWDNLNIRITNGLIKLVGICNNDKVSITLQSEKFDEGDIMFSILPNILLKTLILLPSQPILLDISGNTLTCTTTQRGVYKIPIFDKYNENTNMGDLQYSLNIGILDMINGINKVVPFTGDDPLRPNMNSVCLIADNEFLKFVGTNSHYLCEYKLPYNSERKNRTKILLTKKTSNIINNIFSNIKENEIFVLNLHTNRISFKINNIEAVLDIELSSYPNYEDIIPKNESFIEINKNQLNSCIRRLYAFQKEEGAYNLRLSIDNFGLIVSSETGIKEKNAKENIQTYEHTNLQESMHIGVNSIMVNDILKSISDDIMVMEYKDKSSALIIKDKKDSNTLYLLMPVQLNN